MFNLEKAFDKASLQGIIYKLRHAGLPATGQKISLPTDQEPSAIHPRLSVRPNNLPTQTITDKLQTLQACGIKTSTNEIHLTLHIEPLAARSENNARKFAFARQTHRQLLADFTSYQLSKTQMMLTTF